LNNFRDIELIGSSIRNGRIYFSASDSEFFPGDSFGDRGRNSSRGTPVEFVTTGGWCCLTDVRVSSGVRLSPRRSFMPFITAARAREGARLRVTRVSERQYQVEYLG
jgi:hypothetical protein